MHPFLKLFILVKRSTCFGRSFRPSSGAQNCVYSSVICQTAATTCWYRRWDGTEFQLLLPAAIGDEMELSSSCCYLLLSGMRWNWVPAAATCCYRRWDGTEFQLLLPAAIVDEMELSFSCCYQLLSEMRWNWVPAAATSCYRGWDGTEFQLLLPAAIGDEMELSSSCCYLLLSGMRWNCSSISSPISAGSSSCLTYTQFWAPDDGRRDRPKHVERFTRISNLRNGCILLVVL
jgi:hypothetical protein